MTIQNQEEIIKAIETGDFQGGQGLLTRDQQRQFIVLLKRRSSIFSSVRTVTMPQASMDISKLHIGEPITVSVAENANPTQDNKVLVNQVHLDAQKVKSSHDITTETLQQSLEGDEFELTVMRAMAARLAHDLELLAMLGDESLTPEATDKVGNLLVGNDGWRVLADDSHVLDLDGAEIEPGVFSEALRMLPRQYRGDPDLRWIVGETTVLDWQDHLQGRATALGDAALGDGGPSRAPYGRRMLVASSIPDDLSVPVNESTPAMVVGFRQGPFNVTVGTDDILTVSINGGANQNITFTTDPVAPGGSGTTGSVLETREIVRQINDVFIANGDLARAFDNGDGAVTLRTTTTGAAANVTVVQGGGQDAGLLLGLHDGVGNTDVDGADNSGTILEGTFAILTNPRNLVWGMLDGTRIFTEFNKDFDRIESVTFNQTDAAIENPDAMVLIKNIRRKRHVAFA